MDLLPDIRPAPVFIKPLCDARLVIKLILFKGYSHTEIRFLPVSAKLDISIDVGLNGTLIEAKLLTFKCPIYLFSTS